MLHRKSFLLKLFCAWIAISWLKTVCVPNGQPLPNSCDLFENHELVIPVNSLPLLQLALCYVTSFCAVFYYVTMSCVALRHFALHCVTLFSVLKVKSVTILNNVFVCFILNFYYAKMKTVKIIYVISI